MIMSRWRWGVVSIAGVLLVLAGAYAWLQPNQSSIESLPCEDIVHGCGNQVIQVKAMTAPQTMRAFEMRLESDEPLESVYASFDMKDMHMGLNRYRFQQQPDGSWRAIVTLPVCASGRSDWIIVIDLKRGAKAIKQYQLQFSTQS